jgi:hypothetical protein
MRTRYAFSSVSSDPVSARHHTRSHPDHAHVEVGVEHNPIHAIVAAAQQILVESAQPVRHAGMLQVS